MNFVKKQIEQVEKALSGNPGVWDEVLEMLPEGAELILDEKGAVQGVVLQLTYLFGGDDGAKECDNSCYSN